MRHLRLRAGTIAALSFLLIACGGGGGASAPEIVPPGVKLAAIQPPTGMNFSSFQSSKILHSTDLVFNAGDFADKSHSYVSIWYVDPVDPDGNRQQLAFLTLAAFQGLDTHGGVTLQVPSYITALAYEIYDTDSTVNGGLTL